MSYSFLVMLLPTYDVAISLFSVATKSGSAKMKETIHKYSVALIGLWEKSFGYKHVTKICYWKT